MFHRLVTLPQPLSSASTRLLEYPTPLAIDARRWAVSDGAGRLHVVAVERVTQQWTGTVEASYELLEEEAGSDLLPFRLHSVDVLASGAVIALLSVTAKMAASSTTLSAAERLNIRSTTVFDYLSVDLSTASSQDGDDKMDDVAPTAMEVLWRLRSHDLPSFVTFVPESNRYIIGAASPLFASLADAPSKESPKLPSSDHERVSVSGATITELVESERPPPFSWTQDKESVTLVFAVPSDTPTSSIRATFSRQFLSIIVGDAASALSSSARPADLPRVSHKKLWDTIDPHTSVWTFDREAEGRNSTYGLLSLHLEKGNPGTRWSDVFATSPPIEDGIPSLGVSDRELEGVHETLDPSDLANISESMEKWTQSVAGTDAARLEQGNEQPSSLMGQEIDVEVDGESGRAMVVTWIEDVLSHTPRLVRPHPTIPYALLSTPLPLAGPTTTPDHSIVVKHDVDGAIFSPPLAPPLYSWTHIATFPALAFVLATKRDAYFVHHLADRAVFAFDSPSSSTVAAEGAVGRSGAGNLFVYYNTEGPKDPKGKQMVLRVGGPQSGALMGTSGVQGSDGSTVLLALCEKELVIFRV